MKISRIIIALSLIGSPVHVMAAENYSDFPISDPTEACREAARPYGVAGFNSCINQEQLYYDLAKSDWPDVSAKNRSYCLNLMGKNINSAGFYWGFETCLNERLREQANETPREFHY
jgi:hypothetical protein